MKLNDLYFFKFKVLGCHTHTYIACDTGSSKYCGYPMYNNAESAVHTFNQISMFVTNSIVQEI